MSTPNEPTQIVKPFKATNPSDEPSEDAQSGIVEVEQTPPRVSLVSIAISDTADASMDEDLDAIMGEIENEENQLAQDTALLDEDEEVDEEEKERVRLALEEEMERLGNQFTQPKVATVIPQDSEPEPMSPQFSPPAQAEKGGGTNDVLGFGAIAKTLASMVGFKQQDAQVVRQQAAARFEVQKKQLDDLIFTANNHSQKLRESNTGKIAQGFLDQGIEPPVGSMKSAYALDEGAQSAWRNLQGSMGLVESQVGQLQRTAETAEFEPNKIKDDLKIAVDKLGKDTGANVQGLTDENGNSLSEMLDKYTTRIQEMLTRVLDMLLELVGRKAPEMSP